MLSRCGSWGLQLGELSLRLDGFIAPPLQAEPSAAAMLLRPWSKARRVSSQRSPPHCTLLTHFIVSCTLSGAVDCKIHPSIHHHTPHNSLLTAVYLCALI
jgi:hypothetical protein